MANLTQTAANVAIGGASVPTRRVQYGEAISQGQPIYQSSADSKYYLSDANVEARASCDAIALTPGGLDEYGIVALPSNETDKSLVNLGATLVVGETYVVSATAGAIAPIADLTTGDYPVILGSAKTASLLDFQVINPPAAKA